MNFKSLKLITLAASMIAVWGVSSCKKPVAPVEVTINITSDYVLYVENKGGECEITFDVNAAWTADCNSDWVSLDYDNGTAGSNSIICTVQENPSYKIRNARVNIKAGDVNAFVSISQKPTIPTEYNLLFIGNSFTQDACWHLPCIFNAAVFSPKINMVDMYWGGGIITDYITAYSDVQNSKFTAHTFNAGASTKAWTNRTGKTIQDIVKERKWDVIVLQEHTGNPIAWDWTSTAKANLDKIVDLIKADCKDKDGKAYTPKFVYLFSQSYFDLTKSSKAPERFKDEVDMYNTIVVFAQKVMENCQFEDIIASGTYFQNIRGTSANINKTTYDLALKSARAAISEPYKVSKITE